MDIAVIRDYIIVILGILSIIITIGLLVALVFVFIKVNRLATSINKKLAPVRQWISNVSNLARLLNESVAIFKKQGG